MLVYRVEAFTLLFYDWGDLLHDVSVLGKFIYGLLCEGQIVVGACSIVVGKVFFADA